MRANNLFARAITAPSRLFVAVMILLAGLAAAKATFTQVSIKARATAPSSGGELRCLGGTATGAWPPCTPGSKSQLRGVVTTFRQVSSDPLHTGTRTLVTNASLDESGRGHIWGTWVVTLDDGRGQWEGIFTGSTFGWFGAAGGEVVGHGCEGEVDGMQLKLFFSYENFPIDPATGQPGIETDTGYRLDPRGAR